jgi:hypothetical protein
MLCPVRWCSGSGGLVVMAAARSLSAADHEHLLDTDGFPDWDYMPGEDGHPFEPKASDWGRINGRLGALDYSTPLTTRPKKRPGSGERHAANETAPSPLIVRTARVRNGGSHQPRQALRRRLQPWR